MKPVKPYLAVPTPHILAHRGLHTLVPENTLAAFAAALEAGATHLETDAHCSSDSIAVLVHDPVIVVEGRTVVVEEMTAEQLSNVNLGSGEGIPALRDALARFPQAAFNIDIKSPRAGTAVVTAVDEASARSRVLIASFRAARRSSTARHLPGVATSSSALVSLAVVICASLRLGRLGGWLLQNVDAVQLPVTMLGMRVFTPYFVSMCHRVGVIVHAWTINEPDEMVALVAVGVDGIVTDRCDFATRALAFPHPPKLPEY